MVLLKKEFRIFCPEHPDRICGLIKFLPDGNNGNIRIIIILGDEINQIFCFAVNIDDFQKLEKLLREEGFARIESHEDVLAFEAKENGLYFSYQISGKGMMGWRLLEEL